MLETKTTRRRSSALMLLLVGCAAGIVVVANAMAQDLPSVAPQSLPDALKLQLKTSGAETPFYTKAGTGGQRWDVRDASPEVVTGNADHMEIHGIRSGGIRRITLEDVKQQNFVNRATNNPLARLAQLTVESAKQHRLGLQADYFPKIGATFANLHYSEFLGQVLTVRRPLVGSTIQVPVPLFSQNQTVAAVTFIQPITPLFQVYQAVRIARADERIAMAKAGIPISTNSSDIEIEAAYFKLLIAQRRLTLAELRVRGTEKQRLYAATAIEAVDAPGRNTESLEARKTLLTTASQVKELTATMNRVMGWPVDTELELIPPEPFVESVTLKEIADKPLNGNPDVIEAEQNVIKARAASTLSKLNYVPTVAAVSGYLFQNAIPLVPRNFGYGGVMVSYNIFDFGKREHAVKEANAQLGMAEIAVQMTKAKVAANLKKSYSELEHTRELSQLAVQMGSSVSRLMRVSFAPDSVEGQAELANVEAAMFEADLAHRQAYFRLKALMGSDRD